MGDHKEKRHVMLDGGDVYDVSEKPFMSESKAVILAVFCSFLICMVLFMVLWFGRALEHCDNSYTVAQQGSYSYINPPYYPIIVRGSNTPVRFSLQGLGHQITVSYAICRLFDDGSTVCLNNTQSGVLITDTFVDLYDPEPCREDNSTGLWLQIYSVTPNPIALMYCFASDDVYARKCLQRDSAPPMPLPMVTPASEASFSSSIPMTAGPSGHKRQISDSEKRFSAEIGGLQKAQQRFMFFSTTFSANPDWNQFPATYAWDPLDGYLPQYLPPYPQIGFCGQSLNFRLLDLSYRACYNDLSTTPGYTNKRCSSWVDLKQVYYFNDTLPFMPTAIEGNIVLQIQAAEGPFIAAVGVKPDIDIICGADGSFNLFPTSSDEPLPLPSPQPSSEPSPTPITPKPTSSGH